MPVLKMPFASMYAPPTAFTPNRMSRDSRKPLSFLSILQSVSTAAHACRSAPRTRFSRLTTFPRTRRPSSSATQHISRTEPQLLHHGGAETQREKFLLFLSFLFSSCLSGEQPSFPI